MDELLAQMLQPFKDELIIALREDGKENTPENRLIYMEELLEDIDQVFGESDSLLKRMMILMFEWEIEQERLNINLSNSL